MEGSITSPGMAIKPANGWPVLLFLKPEKSLLIPALTYNFLVDPLRLIHPTIDLLWLVIYWWIRYPLIHPTNPPHIAYVGWIKRSGSTKIHLPHHHHGLT